MTTIRPFEPTDAEYAALAALARAVWPDRSLSVEAFRHHEETRAPDHYFHRIVVDENGEIPAYGVIIDPLPANGARRVELRINVHPERRREGLATRLYAWMLDYLAANPPAPAKLVAGTREDNVGARAMLEWHGYRQTMRDTRSRLDLARFDPAPFEPRRRRVREAGIEIRSLAELMADDPDWEARLYALDREVALETPRASRPYPRPFERWRRRLEAPGFLAEGHLVALEGDRWVGMSALWKLGSVERLHLSFTVVAPRYRRRGIGSALTLRAIEVARAMGARTIQSANEEDNPMRALNRTLGFEPQPAWLEYERPWEGARDWLQAGRAGEARALKGVPT